MPAYTTPGVYVNEGTLTSLQQSTAGTTAAAFFGTAERGPTTATLVQDWSTYKTLFGDLDNQYDLGFAVYHYFQNGGRAAYVNRVVDSTATAATYASVPYYPGGIASASAALFTATAISEGTWGNSLTIQTIAGNQDASATVFGTFTLIVLLSGVEVERWPDLTIDANGNRYAPTVVNNYSRYLRLSATASSTGGASATIAYYTTAVALAGAVEGTVIDTDYTAALVNIDVVEGNLLLNAVGKSSATVVTAFITKAATRGDSFVIIDPLATDTTMAEIQTTAANFSGLSNGGYAAHYAPMLIMADPSKSGPGAIRNTYPGGPLAGLFVRTEVERTVAKAPAGFQADMRGALGLNIKLSDAQVGTLYGGTPQVNTFKANPGAGITVHGARTLNSVNPDKFVSVRRALNYLKTSLKSLTDFAVFEANDERLWTEINMSVSGFLSDFWRAGGLKGATAADAFFVTCDSTNNTATSIDQGIVNVQVGVSLQYPAEFIVINLSQWTGGADAVESL